MVGIVGQNDNEIQRVGVMPFGVTYSLKAVHNNKVTGESCPSSGSCTWILEDDDFIAAVDWAAAHGLDVLSMSFSGDVGSSAFNSLYEAFNNSDVVLISSTGNDPGQSREPQKWEFVIGVGGLDSDSTSIGNEEYEDISALAESVWTTAASCTGVDFCDPDGSGQVDNTSPATAIVAGAAGLIRSHEPGLGASWVRSRLLSTADGTHNRLNAFEGIVDNPPFASISGPSSPPAQDTASWFAQITDGLEPFSYEWIRDDSVVSTSDSYTGYIACKGFKLELSVSDSLARSSADTLVVSPDCSEADCQFCFTP